MKKQTAKEQTVFAGQTVEIVGLQHDTDFNGAVGIVDQVTWKSVYVRLDNDTVVQCLPENVVPTRKPVGTPVK